MHTCMCRHVTSIEYLTFLFLASIECLTFLFLALTMNFSIPFGAGQESVNAVVQRGIDAMCEQEAGGETADVAFLFDGSTLRNLSWVTCLSK
jgi:hypothetical protein